MNLRITLLSKSKLTISGATLENQHIFLALFSLSPLLLICILILLSLFLTLKMLILLVNNCVLANLPCIVMGDSDVRWYILSQCHFTRRLRRVRVTLSMPITFPTLILEGIHYDLHLVFKLPQLFKLLSIVSEEVLISLSTARMQILCPVHIMRQGA